MFGNDPQCRAPNSEQRKVWSSEGIKQPLHLVRRPGHHLLGRTSLPWADINSWSGHHSGWTLQEERRLHRVWITFAVIS